MFFNLYPLTLIFLPPSLTLSTKLENISTY